MKKPLLTLFLFLFICVCISAQDAEHMEKSAIPIGFTLGMDFSHSTSQDFLFSMSFGMEFFLPARFSIGFNLFLGPDDLSSLPNSYDHDAAFLYFLVYSNVFEPSLMLRYYILPWADQHSGFYVQADLGVCIYVKQRDAVLRFGLRSGYNFVFDKTFGMELFIRAGYPFYAGGGLIFGFRL